MLKSTTGRVLSDYLIMSLMNSDSVFFKQHLNEAVDEKHVHPAKRFRSVCTLFQCTQSLPGWLTTKFREMCTLSDIFTREDNTGNFLLAFFITLSFSKKS